MVLWPLLVNGFVVLLLALGTRTLISRNRRFAAAALLVASLVGLAAFLVRSRPEATASLLPFADGVYFANWFPFAVALAGPAAVQLGRTRWQKMRLGILSLILLGVATTDTWRLYGRPAATGPPGFFAPGICRQSSTDSCSAASCVTLLAQYGIEATEADMARRALTKEGRGTSPLGIYRALRMAVSETTTGLSVRLARLTADELINLGRPAVVLVGLPRIPASALETELAAKYQWEPGFMHSVVLLRPSGEENKVRIADPDLGVEDWPVEQFAALFRGTTLHLSSAPPRSTAR